MEKSTYKLVNDDGCLMASVQSTSMASARRYFNNYYEGSYVIVCGEKNERKNVILK
jgi:hypothetical protein